MARLQPVHRPRAPDWGTASRRPASVRRDPPPARGRRRPDRARPIGWGGRGAPSTSPHAPTATANPLSLASLAARRASVDLPTPASPTTRSMLGSPPSAPSKLSLIRPNSATPHEGRTGHGSMIADQPVMRLPAAFSSVPSASSGAGVCRTSGRSGGPAGPRPLALHGVTHAGGLGEHALRPALATQPASSSVVQLLGQVILCVRYDDSASASLASPQSVAWTLRAGARRRGTSVMP